MIPTRFAPSPHKDWGLTRVDYPKRGASKKARSESPAHHGIHYGRANSEVAGLRVPRRASHGFVSAASVGSAGAFRQHSALSRPLPVSR
jgi:hypothetical protein